MAAGSLSGCGSTAASGSGTGGSAATGSGAGAGTSGAGTGSGSITRVAAGSWPVFSELSEPWGRLSSERIPRLKNPIVRAYSHTLAPFLPLQ